MVLVRRDRNERCFGENMSAEGGVFGAESVVFIRLYNVDPRLVFMHGVQNYLKVRKWITCVIVERWNRLCATI